MTFCWLVFIPAANAGSFLFFRGALFGLARGLATLETVAHPFIAALGNQRSSDQRPNSAQSFNGPGAVIGPVIGGYFILRAGQGGGRPASRQNSVLQDLRSRTGIALIYNQLRINWLVRN